MSDLYDVVQAKVSTAINDLRAGDGSMHQVILTSSDTGPLPVQTILHWVHDLMPRDMVLYSSWEEKWENRPVLNLAIQKVEETIPANENDWKVRALAAEEKIAKVRDALDAIESGPDTVTAADNLQFYFAVSRAVRR